MRQRFRFYRAYLKTLGEQGKKRYTGPDDLADMMPILGFDFLNWTKIIQRNKRREKHKINYEPLNEHIYVKYMINIFF